MCDIASRKKTLFIGSSYGSARLTEGVLCGEFYEQFNISNIQEENEQERFHIMMSLKIPLLSNANSAKRCRLNYATNNDGQISLLIMTKMQTCS